MNYEYANDRLDFVRWLAWRNARQLKAFSFTYEYDTGSLRIEFRCPECSLDSSRIGFGLSKDKLDSKVWREFVSYAIRLLRAEARCKGHKMTAAPKGIMFADPPWSWKEDQPVRWIKRPPRCGMNEQA